MAKKNEKAVVKKHPFLKFGTRIEVTEPLVAYRNASKKTKDLDFKDQYFDTITIGNSKRSIVVGIGKNGLYAIIGEPIGARKEAEPTVL